MGGRVGEENVRGRRVGGKSVAYGRVCKGGEDAEVSMGKGHMGR